jgi:hypothetical protein
MIIYNKIWLVNLQLHNSAKMQQQAGNISIEELKKIVAAFPVGFYQPGIFARAGFFILTCIGISFSSALLTLIMMDAHIADRFGWPIFLGICCYIVLEIMVKSNHYFRSGIDEALLYSAGGLLAGGIIWMILDMHISNNTSGILISISTCLLAIYLTLRFADTLTSAISGAAFLAFVFFTWQNLGSFGMATMPFVMMIASAALYFLIKRISKTPQAIYYEHCILISKIIGLLGLYAAGNYYVVQQLSNELNHIPADVNKPIPFGFMFWIWTMLLPLVYVAIGIRNKKLMFIRLGLILVAASVATFRNYCHLLPPEVMLTIAGLLVLGLIYALIKYLKTPKHGFTYQDIDNSESAGNIQLESLVIGETMSRIPSAPEAPKDIFGGGSAGGGGTSGNF